MKKLTDFQIAALSAVPGIIGGAGASAVDIWWAAQDYALTGLDHLPTVMYGLGITLIAFVISTALLIWAWKRHKDTGEKPIQSKDDIDYRVALAIAKQNMKILCAKEKAIRRRRAQ